LGRPGRERDRAQGRDDEAPERRPEAAHRR
jgi:hypothetical protein